MAERFQQKRDFGQKKRAVTMAGTAVKNFIAAYESIDAKAITDHEEAEEMLKKIKHHKRTLCRHCIPILENELMIKRTIITLTRNFIYTTKDFIAIQNSLED